MGHLRFVTGGVRSGKSHFAEQLVGHCQTTAAYVATSVAFDQEMKERIAKHKLDRATGKIEWHLYEMPYQLSTEVSEQVVLFECVTTWLTNRIFMQQDNNPVPFFQRWVEQLITDGKQVIIVSNEVLDAGLTPYDETNTYLQRIGELHQWLVKEANEVYEINHTIVKRWK